MKLPRRQILRLAAGAAALPAVLRTATAQDYPARPVRIVVPYAAATSPDINQLPDSSIGYLGFLNVSRGGKRKLKSSRLGEVLSLN